MKRYTPEELSQIFSRIAPELGIWAPLPPPAPSSRRVGPVFSVYPRYSDIVGTKDNLEQRYWDALRQTPVLGGIGELAAINGILSEHRTGEPDIHRQLNEKFFAPDLRAKVGQFNPGGPACATVFTKIGCLQIMRHLMLYGNVSIDGADRPVNRLGELMLLANEFILPEPAFKSPHATNLELLLSFLPIWDICNPRELAYSLSRMFTILTEILPGTDREVQRLASRLGMDTKRIVVDDLPLNDFIATVFGLYSYGRTMVIPEQAIFDVNKVFSRVGFPIGILRNLVKKRSLGISEFRELLRNGNPCGFDNLVDEIRRRAFVSESLTIFRKFPFLQLDADRALILDLQFLVDLLTSGVYWSIFNGLPTNRRDTFRQLWGRLFELYAVNLLKKFYPRASGIFSPDLQYESGQVDGLLDFGNEVLLLEIKASLLTEPAKRTLNSTEFVSDFNRKFVQNEKGSPKAILQLTSSCMALENGTIRTATRPTRIYPIFVSDEPGIETFFFNAYMNEIFQKELHAGSRIQPLTVMSINELEEVLPYVAENAFGWSELLQSRFNALGVGPTSVHQAIYDLCRSKGLPSLRNQAIRGEFDKVWAVISGRYKPTAA